MEHCSQAVLLASFCGWNTDWEITWDSKLYCIFQHSFWCSCICFML